MKPVHLGNGIMEESRSGIRHGSVIVLSMAIVTWYTRYESVIECCYRGLGAFVGVVYKSAGCI